MTAVIDVGVTALASAIARPRSRTKTIACSADRTPTPAAAVISPTECPATTPTNWIAIGWMREEFERGQQTSGNQQRLSDRRVSDGFGVGFCAVVPEIEAGDCGEPVEPVSESRYVEPGLEKPGCLGTLTGRHNREHICTISWSRTKKAYGDATNIRTSYCQFPTVCLVLPLAHRAQ